MPEPLPRIAVQARATVTILAAEIINVRQQPARRTGGPARQTSRRDGAPQIDFY